MNYDPTLTTQISFDDRKTPINNPFISGTGTGTAATPIAGTLFSHTATYTNSLSEGFSTGTTATVFFRVHNRDPRETAAVAVYNVTPEVSGAWFNKISCFCFSEQKLGPNETAELPVVFFLDPRLEKDHTMDAVDAITLSYTLFAPSNAAKPVALGAPPGKGSGRL